MPVVFGIGVWLGLNVERHIGLLLMGSYTAGCLSWLAWRVRCPRCSYHAGRAVMKTGKDIAVCPKCRVDFSGRRSAARERTEE